VLYDEAMAQQPAASTVLAAQHRADAVGRIAEAALAGGLDQGTRGDRYQVVVHVDAEVLAEADGAGKSGVAEVSDAQRIPGASEIEGVGNVPAGTSLRIACDASIVVMTHDHEGRILDVGRKTRVISPALRRALTYRDAGCRFPGCGLKFCDAHHVEHWAEGGETRLDNLVLLCKMHHRCVHEEGYGVECTAGGEFRFLRPDGREIPAAPPAAAQAATTAEMTGAQAAAVEIEAWLTGAEVDADWTAYEPEWDGSRLDLHWAIGVMWSGGGRDSRP